MKKDQQVILAEIERIVNQIVDERLELKPDMTIREGLALNSIDQMALWIEIENHFEISFDERDEEKIKTVSDLVDRVFWESAQ